MPDHHLPSPSPSPDRAVAAPARAHPATALDDAQADLDLILLKLRGQVPRVLGLTGTPPGTVVMSQEDLTGDRSQVAA